nr:MAG TPA: hypothetical protein [Caudoviricetes sp.]
MTIFPVSKIHFCFPNINLVIDFISYSINSIIVI